MSAAFEPRKIGFLLVCVLAASVLSGCKLPSGHYSGNLTLSQIPGVSDLKNKIVRTEVSYAFNQGGKIVVRDFAEKQDLLKPFQLTYYTGNHFYLTLPDLGNSSYRMSRTTATCFENKSDTVIEICFDDEAFSLQVRQNGEIKIDLTGTSFEPQPPVQYEPVRDYTVKEGVMHAIQNNYDVQLERENVIQANAAAKSSWFNLFPHLGLNSIIAIGTSITPLAPFTMLVAAGDVVPFLFPSNYISIVVSKWQARAEHTASVLLKANTAASVHGLMINYIGLRNIVQDLQTLESRISFLVDKVGALEGGKKVRVRSTADIVTVRNTVRTQILAAQSLAGKERGIIAMMMGLKNPGGVGQVILDETALNPWEFELTPGEYEKTARDYAEIGIANSFEIKQQDFLMRAARWNEVGLFLSWTNPYGSPAAELGLGLISADQTIRSIQTAIQLRIDSLRQVLTRNAFAILGDRDTRVRSYHVAQQSRTNDFHRLDVVLAPIETESTDLEKMRFIATDAQSIVQDVVNTVFNYHTHWATAQIDQIALDRMVLQGVYQELFPYFEGLKEPTNPLLD